MGASEEAPRPTSSCRVCWEKDETANLLTPCACKGTWLDPAAGGRAGGAGSDTPCRHAGWELGVPRPPTLGRRPKPAT